MLTHTDGALSSPYLKAEAPRAHSVVNTGDQSFTIPPRLNVHAFGSMG